MDKISKDLTRGTLWIAFSRYSNQFISLLIGAILSRLLFPSEFGVVAMVLVFSGFIAIFNDAGIKSYIIQHPELTNEAQSLVFFLSLGIGCIMSLLLFVSAPLIEHFYKFDGLADVTRVLSFQFIFSAISFVPRGILERKLKFKSTGLIELAVSVFTGAVGVTLAFFHFGYWSLIIRNLSADILVAILLFTYSKWTPSLKVRGQNFNFLAMLGFSGNLTLFGIINYWGRNLDNLLIGKFLGSISLGYYNRAYGLMTYPITLFSSVINPILHPVFAGIQTDVNQIRINYLNVLKILAIISFPVVTFLAINAVSVITVVWGGQWKQSILVFQILGIASLFQPILNTTGSIFLVRNKTNWLFWVGLINSAIIITGILIGLRFGINGVALGYTISFLFMLLPLLYVVFNILLEGSLWELFTKISTSFILVFLIIISNSIVLYMIKNIYINLLTNIILSLSIFLLTVWYFENDLFKMILNKMKSRI